MTTSSDSKSITEVIRKVLESGTRAVLATLVDPAATNAVVGAKLIVGESGKREESLGREELDDAVAQHASIFLQGRDEARAFRVAEFAPELTQLADARILFERIESEPRLVIAGAGHVGASLARLAMQTGYRVTLIDDRAEFVNPDLFPCASGSGIELVAATDWQEAVSSAIGSGRGVAVAIVTRGHKQDEDCLRAAITKRPDYVGMIGSRRRTNIVLDKLREEGTKEEQLRKVHAPIGLDIGAISPEEVALAILAEIVAERRGGSGAPLSSWRRKLD